MPLNPQKRRKYPVSDTPSNNQRFRWWFFYHSIWSRRLRSAPNVNIMPKVEQDFFATHHFASCGCDAT